MLIDYPARLVSMTFVIALVTSLARATEDPVKEPKAPTIEELDKLPTGLKITHKPSPALATLTGKSDRRAKYTWWYKTTVTATDDDVTIEQFGGFVLVDGKWVDPTAGVHPPYTAKELAEWYKCDGATISKGKPAVDPTNWSSFPELIAVKHRWFFIGVDAKGRRVKGEAIIELKPEIDPKMPRDAE
jgi:hypothetical protein